MKTVESDHVGWVTETGALIGDYEYFFLSQAQKELCKPFMPRISPNKEQSVQVSDTTKAETSSTGWYELQPIATKLIGGFTEKQIHDKLIEMFPLEEGQQYVGSLVNHFRGRLKNEGKLALINQMSNNSMRTLILALEAMK